MQHLWLLTRPRETTHPDERRGCVVRASNEVSAREIAAGTSWFETVVNPHTPGDEGPDTWLDPTKSTCVELVRMGPPGIVIEDFCSA